MHLSSHRSFCWSIFTHSMPLYLEEGCFNNFHYDWCLPCNWIFKKVSNDGGPFILPSKPILCICAWAKTHHNSKFFKKLYDGFSQSNLWNQPCLMKLYIHLFWLGPRLQLLDAPSWATWVFLGPYFISNVTKSLCLLFTFLFVVYWICTWLNITIISNFKNACLYGLQLSCSSYYSSSTCFWILFACTLSFKYRRSEGWNCGAYLACKRMDHCCRLHLITHIHLFLPLQNFASPFCSIIVTILLQTRLWPYFASYIGAMAILVDVNTPRRSTTTKCACT